MELVKKTKRYQIYKCKACGKGIKFPNTTKNGTYICPHCSIDIKVTGGYTKPYIPKSEWDTYKDCPKYTGNTDSIWRPGTFMWHFEDILQHIGFF